MKLPGKVIIYGREWKVVKDPKSNGGNSVTAPRPEIHVGTKEKSRIPEIFLHEVIESILMDNCLRFRAPHVNSDNGDYVFIFNHQQFENIVPQIVLALKDVLELVS